MVFDWHEPASGTGMMVKLRGQQAVCDVENLTLAFSETLTVSPWIFVLLLLRTVLFFELNVNCWVFVLLLSFVMRLEPEAKRYRNVQIIISIIMCSSCCKLCYKLI